MTANTIWWQKNDTGADVISQCPACVECWFAVRLANSILILDRISGPTVHWVQFPDGHVGSMFVSLCHCLTVCFNPVFIWPLQIFSYWMNCKIKCMESVMMKTCSLYYCHFLLKKEIKMCKVHGKCKIIYLLQ